MRVRWAVSLVYLAGPTAEGGYHVSHHMDVSQHDEDEEREAIYLDARRRVESANEQLTLFRLTAFLVQRCDVDTLYPDRRLH